MFVIPLGLSGRQTGQPRFVAIPFSWLWHRSLYRIDGIRFFQIADVCSDVGNQLQVSFNQHNQTFVPESV